MWVELSWVSFNQANLTITLNLFVVFSFSHVQQTYPGGLNSSAFGTKQSSFSQSEASINQGSNDSWAEVSDESGLQESYPKWMQVRVF